MKAENFWFRGGYIDRFRLNMGFLPVITLQKMGENKRSERLDKIWKASYNNELRLLPENQQAKEDIDKEFEDAEKNCSLVRH